MEREREREIERQSEGKINSEGESEDVVSVKRKKWADISKAGRWGGEKEHRHVAEVPLG